MNNVKVSVCCITYNHGKYLRDALESFINQITNFNYEIIIHDDYSTDNTVDIINEYKKKYPDIIVPMFEIENQYSKGIKSALKTFEKAKGKYIAICEGDDFWCDKYKLQKQFDIMEKNKKATLCFHNAVLYNRTKKTYKKYINKNDMEKEYYNKSEYNSGELLCIKYCGNIPTASMFFKKECIKTLPDFYHKLNPGDMTLKLHFAGCGKALYINEIMSAYRRNVEGSSTTTWKNDKDIKSIENRIDQFIKIIESYDEFSNYKYTTELQKCKKRYLLDFNLEKNEYDKIINSPDNYIYRIAHDDRFLLKIRIKKILYKLRKKKNGKK